MPAINKFLLMGWEFEVQRIGVDNCTFGDMFAFVSNTLHNLTDQSRIKGLDYLHLLGELDT